MFLWKLMVFNPAYNLVITRIKPRSIHLLRKIAVENHNWWQVLKYNQRISSTLLFPSRSLRNCPIGLLHHLGSLLLYLHVCIIKPQHLRAIQYHGSQEPMMEVSIHSLTPHSTPTQLVFLIYGYLLSSQIAPESGSWLFPRGIHSTEELL